MFFAEFIFRIPVGMEETLNKWALGIKNLPQENFTKVRFLLLRERIKAAFRDEQWEYVADLKEELDIEMRKVSGAVVLRSTSYMQLLLFAIYRHTPT